VDPVRDTLLLRKSGSAGNRTRDLCKKRTIDLWNTRREIQTNKTGSTTLKEWTTPDLQNTPSTTNLEEENIVDALGNDGNVSMPERVNRPNPQWRKMMMIYTKVPRLHCDDVKYHVHRTQSCVLLFYNDAHCTLYD
jgi:hypothetical protein